MEVPIEAASPEARDSKKDELFDFKACNEVPLITECDLTMRGGLFFLSFRPDAIPFSLVI